MLDLDNAKSGTALIICALMQTTLLGACASAGPQNLYEGTIQNVSNQLIENYLQERVTDDHFTGAVLVARGAQIIHAKGYGAATSELENNVETLFHVASITKQFTATAVMQLVEAGLVDLDKSINTYLPERYRSTYWGIVTVHHVLTHSGGIPDYAVERDYYNVVDGFCLGDTVDGMIQEAMTKELEFVPGSKFAYSNIGFTLLGSIIENISGNSYEDYMEQRVLRPMGMLSSKIHVEGHTPGKNEAKGFRWSEEKAIHVPDDIVSLPVTAPDGGLITTLSDFHRWIRIYSGAQDRVLSQSSIDQITGRHIATDAKGGPIDSYGYGLATGAQHIGHSGYIVGFRSWFVLVPEQGLLIVLFTNNTYNNPRHIVSGLLSILQES